MQKIPYGRHSIQPEDIEAVRQVLESDFLTQGPRVKEFEDTFARYVGAKYAVAVNNGTAALHLSVMALGLKPGHKVITTPISFVATANCVLYCGAEVVFADIDEETGLIDIDAVEALLKASPKGTYAGIIPVDFAGLAVDVERLRLLADEFKLWVLEDACHAPGAYFTDSNGVKQHCGNGKYSHATVFSFHPVKHIATGEGGMVTTNSPEIFEKLMQLRTHGITRDSARYENTSDFVAQGGWYYEMQSLGYNFRMPDILAALGTSQLRRAEVDLANRRRIAQRYDSVFNTSDSHIKPLAAGKNNEGHAYHLYIVKTNQRQKLYDFLHQRGILAQVHYIPIHLQPYYRRLGYKQGSLPRAESFYGQVLSLPMFGGLSSEMQDQVIQHTKDFR